MIKERNWLLQKRDYCITTVLLQHIVNHFTINEIMRRVHKRMDQAIIKVICTHKRIFEKQGEYVYIHIMNELRA